MRRSGPLKPTLHVPLRRAYHCVMTFRFLRYTLALAIIALAGCEASSKHSAWEGPHALQPVNYDSWNFHDHAGQTLHTTHYVIHTTIDNKEFLNRLAQVMEGSYTQYQKLAPLADASNAPMQCFVFDRRPEWVAVTREHPG